MLHFIRAGESPAFPDRVEEGLPSLVALGGELTCEVVCEAYRKGIFPWSGEDPITWHSPDPRLILLPERLHVSRSLRTVIRRGRFEIRFDADFAGTIRDCARMPRPGQGGTWITPNVIATYSALHDRGIAHSVEAWRDGRRVGGLYGLTFGAAFFGESMFAREPDASKVALVALVERLREWRFDFLDCQQVSPHMLALGATPVPRADYLCRLAGTLTQPSRWYPWGREGASITRPVSGSRSGQA